MWETYAAGAAAALTVDALIYPLDTLKTRYQSQDFVKTFVADSNGPSKATGAKPLFRGLYQGIGSVVIVTLPAAGIFFSVYESTKDMFSEQGTMRGVLSTSASHACASSIAEMASCLVLTPAEVIKQNAQMLQKQQSATRGKDGASTSTSLRALRQVTQGSSWRTLPNLWRGYGALVARNLPFTAIQFPLFERLKVRIGAYQKERRQQQGKSNSATLLETGTVSGLSAGLAGGLSAFLTTPTDVLKTRMMLDAGQANSNDSGTTTSTSRRGIRAIAGDIWNERGVRGFFRGGLLRSSWTAVGSGLYLGTYEMAKKYLKEEVKGEEDGERSL